MSSAVVTDLGTTGKVTESAPDSPETGPLGPTSAVTSASRGPLSVVVLETLASRARSVVAAAQDGRDSGSPLWDDEPATLNELVERALVAFCQDSENRLNNGAPFPLVTKLRTGPMASGERRRRPRRRRTRG